MKGFKVFRSLTALILALSMLLSLGVGAFAANEKAADASLAPKAQETTQPLAENGKDYLFMDFKPGSWERNLAWSGYCGGYDDSRVTWTDSDDGELQFTFNHYDSSLRMPVDWVNRLNYVFKPGDIIEVRLRFDAVTDFTAAGKDIKEDSTESPFSSGFFIVDSGNTDKNGAPHLEQAHSFTTKSGNHPMLNTGMQTLTYTENYTSNGTTLAGSTLYNLRFDVLNGSSSDAFTKDVTVAIDYIYIGPADKTPVDVVYYGEDGTSVLHEETIPYGYPSTWNNHDKKSTSENGLISLWGWSVHQPVNGEFVDIAEFRVNPSLYPLTIDTKYYLARNTLEDAGSTKTLSLGDDPNSTDDFKITIDASNNALLSDQTYATPLDVAIILDRSGSMGMVADYDNPDEYFTISNETIPSGKKVPTQLTNAIAKLDKTKPDGYYHALAWPVCSSGVSYGNFEYKGTKDEHTDHTYCGRDSDGNHASTVYSAPVRYHNGEWQMQILQNCTCNGNYQRPSGVYYQTVGSMQLEQCIHNTWVSLEDGYLDYISKRTADTNITGMSQANKAKCHFLLFASRMGKAMEAIETFAGELYASTPMLPEGESHSISLISYGRIVYEKNYPIAKGMLNTRVYGMSMKTKELNAASYKELVSALHNTYVYGHTRTDAALQLLAGEPSDLETAYGRTEPTFAATDYLPEAKDGRNRVVILMTDGAPTKNVEFQKPVADSAVIAAGKLKAEGCEIFTIGFMEGLTDTKGYDSTVDYREDYQYASQAKSNDRQRANNFLNLVSSNYPKASSMEDKGDEDNFTAGEKYFYADDGSGSMLMEHFREILNKVAPELVSATDKPLYLYDEITREFTVDAKGKVKVFAVPYSPNGFINEKKIQLDTDHTITPSMSSSTIEGTGYELLWNPSASSNTCSVTLKWTDAPLAFTRMTLSDTAEQSAVAKKYNNDAEGLNFDYGYRIIVEIPIVVNRENTIGGNNINTNVNTSGLYYENETVPGTKADHAHIQYKVPNANVSTSLESPVYDYFNGLSSAIDMIENNATDKNDFKDIIQSLIDTSVLPDLIGEDGGCTVEHVECVKVIVKDENDNIIYEKLVYGDTEYTETYNIDDTKFDFMADQQFTVEYIVEKKIGSTTDDVNVDPYETIWEVSTANYYAPKFAIIDFDGVISVPMDMESATKSVTDEAGKTTEIPRLTYIELEEDDSNGPDGGTYDAESGSIKFDLRDTYGSNEQPLLQNKDYKSFSYTFEAINPRKGVELTDGKDIVPREVIILPANVMTYDDEVLWGAAHWSETDDYVQGEQEFNNELRHGYDSNFANVSGDLHGSARYATVTAKKNNTQMSAEFWGDGFEILSRTGKDSGAMLVELRSIIDYDPATEIATNLKTTEQPEGKLLKVILVNTYLDGETLYQVPVVQMNNMTYGGYKVNIYAYYNKAFDQNLGKRSVMTEEKAREILGLDESVDFTYIPSVSEAACVANRGAAPEATEGQYNVYVDGLRVYNTRGDLTFQNKNGFHKGVNKIFQYVYSLAGEYDLATGGSAKFENVSDLIIDAGSDVDWSAKETEGVLYIAGHGEAVNGDTVNTNTDGFMLNMSGKIKESEPVMIKIDGVETEVRYPLDADNNKYEYAPASEGDYKAYIYYRERPSKKVYFCALDKEGKEIILTDTEVRQIIGGGTNLAYYDSKYDLMGPEHEIYIPAPEGESYRGIAFNVENASKVRISVKAINGAINLDAYNGSAWETVVANYDSKTEMYFDVPVTKDGAVILRNAGENVLSICNIKMLGTSAEAKPLTSVKPATMMMAISLFDNETPILDDGVQMSHSLTLKSGISINYLAKAEQLDEYDSFYMEVVAPVYEGNVQVGTETYRLEPTAVGNLYYFVMDEVAAKQMNDVLQARIYMTKDGATYVSRLDEYSVANYAYNQLLNAKADEELKALCVNLLRYGAEAQKYWSYRTDSLADEEIAAEFAGLLTDLNGIELESKMAMLNDVEAPVASWKDASLLLESKIVIRYTANLAEFDGNVEDLTARFSFINHEGETVVEEVKNFTVLDAEKKLYSVYFDGIDADELRVVVSAAIFCGDTQISCTAQYSVESYVARVTGSVLTLCKAMMAYGDSVEAFFN